MINDRASVINIGGEEYTLLLTTRATKEIAGRYGGLENLGDKLMKSENFDMTRMILTEEMVELLTVPADLATYKSAIMDALLKGTKRNIESEADEKNAAVE